jgi:hypothetical protein
MRCRGLHGLAIPAFLKGFLFSELPSIAPHCVPGGIRVISKATGSLARSGATRLWIVQLTSLQLRFACKVAAAHSSDRVSPLDKEQDGLEPATFGATIRRHRLPRVAPRCKNRLSKRISMLAVADSCCVLRSGWCQEWCQTAPLTTALVGVIAQRTTSGVATYSKI